MADVRLERLRDLVADMRADIEAVAEVLVSWGLPGPSERVRTWSTRLAGIESELLEMVLDQDVVAELMAAHEARRRWQELLPPEELPAKDNFDMRLNHWVQVSTNHWRRPLPAPAKQDQLQTEQELPRGV